MLSQEKGFPKYMLLHCIFLYVTYLWHVCRFSLFTIVKIGCTHRPILCLMLMCIDEMSKQMLTGPRWFLFLSTANQMYHAYINFYFIALTQLCLVSFIIIVVCCCCFCFWLFSRFLTFSSSIVGNVIDQIDYLPFQSIVRLIWSWRIVNDVDRLKKTSNKDAVHQIINIDVLLYLARFQQIFHYY